MNSRGRGQAIEGALAFIRSKNAQDKAMLRMIEPVSCNCERAMRNVICKSCGFIFAGRVRTRCGVHPTIIHLMDVDSCPECKANDLKEFGSVDLHDHSRHA